MTRRALFSFEFSPLLRYDAAFVFSVCLGLTKPTCMSKIVSVGMLEYQSVCS